ncbi:hypothetical protein EYF80_037980 [Liparis tanakae]|uniref:Uncharacterized protein n=1 Tax=Liparis tanakae TaxID=230148 RepID=A0A4Z2GGL7_9TELE|nr:hypothetical protein EYF80_037980 [Liparis tanakae]
MATTLEYLRAGYERVALASDESAKLLQQEPVHCRPTHIGLPTLTPDPRPPGPLEGIEAWGNQNQNQDRTLETPELVLSTGNDKIKIESSLS